MAGLKSDHEPEEARDSLRIGPGQPSDPAEEADLEEHWREFLLPTMIYYLFATGVVGVIISHIAFAVLVAFFGLR